MGRTGVVARTFVHSLLSTPSKHQSFISFTTFGRDFQHTFYWFPMAKDFTHKLCGRRKKLFTGVHCILQMYFIYVNIFVCFLQHGVNTKQTTADTKLNSIALIVLVCGWDIVLKLILNKLLQIPVSCIFLVCVHWSLLDQGIYHSDMTLCCVCLPTQQKQMSPY